MENNKKEVIRKTVAFLNAVRNQLNDSPRIENVGKIATSFFTSHASFTSAQRLGYFTKIGVKRYKCNVEMFDDSHAIAVLDLNRTYYADKKKEKIETVKKSLVENLEDDWSKSIFGKDAIKEAYLHELPIETLLAELKRRGITGTIDVVKQIKF